MCGSSQSAMCRKSAADRVFHRCPCLPGNPVSPCRRPAMGIDKIGGGLGVKEEEKELEKDEL